MPEGKRDVISQNYNIDIDSIKFSGIYGVLNPQTGHEEIIDDVRLVNVQGYCKPFGSNQANDINCPGNKIICETDLESTMGRPQSFQCILTKGEFKAFKNGKEVPVAFRGLTSISTEVEVLKKGIQCTSSQIVNCNDGEICMEYPYYLIENSECIFKTKINLCAKPKVFSSGQECASALFKGNNKTDGNDNNLIIIDKPIIEDNKDNNFKFIFFLILGLIIFLFWGNNGKK